MMLNSKISNHLPQTRLNLIKISKNLNRYNSEIITSNQRMNDHWKRRSFPFKMLPHLSQYDFRFPRYHRVKKKIIFHNLVSSTRISLTDLSQTLDKRQTRFLEKQSKHFQEK